MRVRAVREGELWIELTFAPSLLGRPVLVKWSQIGSKPGKLTDHHLLLRGLPPFLIAERKESGESDSDTFLSVLTFLRE